jgi:antitoxin (DNA-binding transcriptional repressor) of toxin-antitoxin stability system
MLCHVVSMKSITLRQLRDTKQVKTWLRAGVHIEVRERDEVIADLVPRTPPKPPVEWPDFEARAKAIFGDRVLNIVDDMIEERNSRY